MKWRPIVLVRGSLSRREVLVACLASWLLAAGCSGSSGSSPAVIKLTGAEIAVLTDSKAADAAYVLANNATQTLVEQCMRAKGLVYYPNFDSTANAATLAGMVPGVPQAKIGLASREATGYGFYAAAVQQAAHPGGQNQPDTEDRYVATLPAAVRQSYLLALRGTLSRQVTVTMLGGGTAQTQAGGCQAAARRQVYGSLANSIQVTSGWSQLSGQLTATVTAGPAYTAAVARWSKCMAAHGYRYHTPGDLWNRLGTRIDLKPTSALRVLEIKTSVADYQCAATVRLIQTIRALQEEHARYVSRALAEGLARIAAIDARALKVARALHVTG